MADGYPVGRFGGADRDQSARDGGNERRRRAAMHMLMSIYLNVCTSIENDSCS